MATGSEEAAPSIFSRKQALAEKTINALWEHAMVVLRAFLLSIVLLAILAPGAEAAGDIPGPVAAEVERVIDGDTVRVSAKIWVDQRISTAVRIYGVDAPELFRPQCEAERAAARKAKSFVEAIIDAGVMLGDISHDKYGGRVVARLETTDGIDIGAALLEAGLAVEIGAGDPWCE